MVRSTASLQNHFRSGQLAEKSLNLAALEFSPQNRPLPLVNTMQRENMFGRINRNTLIFHLGGPFIG